MLPLLYLHITLYLLQEGGWWEETGEGRGNGEFWRTSNFTLFKMVRSEGPEFAHLKNEYWMKRF